MAEVEHAAKDDYFRLPSTIPLVLAPMGMVLVSMAAFTPAMIPYPYLGPLGTLTKYFIINMHSVVKGVAIMAWILHFGEAYYASVVCKSKNISRSASRKWVFLVFLCGIFSFKHLLAYEGKKKNN